MALIRALSGSSGGGGITSITQDPVSPITSQRSVNYTLEIGKVYLILLWNGGGTMSPTQYDGATCTGGTLTKTGNLYGANYTSQGTFFQLVPTQTNVTVTHQNPVLFILFSLS